MGTIENKQLVHDAFAALNAGNQDVFLSSLAEDVSWTIMGTTKYSINCVGKKELTDKLFTPLAGLLDGFITNTILNTVADGDYVVLQTQGKSRTKSGKAYNNTYCLVIQLNNMKIQKVTEYLDTELVNTVLG